MQNPETQTPYEIYAKSPTRVDLAGGTLDLWPLYVFLGEAFTVNTAVSIFTHCILRPHNSSEIRLHIKDMKAEKSYPNLAACLGDTDERFLLLRKHIQYWKPQRGFELVTWSESPVGAGLGGSSSLSVTISGAFANFEGRKLETSEWVHLVGNVEAQVLRKPTGTQDYYPAILGGLNSLHYQVDSCHIRRMHLDQDAFEKSFILVYTGCPHHSGMNNWQVLKDAIDGHESTLKALEELRQVSAEMHRACDQKNWGILKNLLNREFEARIHISAVFSSPEIERLKEVALRAGADAVKICGAGGGGCVMLWCPAGQKESVSSQCQKAGFQILNALPTEERFCVVRRPLTN